MAGLDLVGVGKRPALPPHPPRSWGLSWVGMGSKGRGPLGDLISALAGGGETGKEMERDGERKRSRGRENRGQRSERAARSQAWAPPCLGFPSLRSLSPCPALGALLGTPHGASSRVEWQPGAPDRRPFLSTDRVIMRILHLGSEKLSDLFKVTLGSGRVWIQPSSG